MPPKASPAVCVPAPARANLPVINDPPVDHEVPLYSSVHDARTKLGKYISPPKAIPAFCVPAPAI